jgi:ATPase subunit of ABC transporter with duplicated ATPase domains
MISVVNLSMRYGGKILFKNANVQFNPGRHYGLVGANGSGKSTFIKILIGELTPESGDVAVPSQITVGALKQDHYLYEETPIIDTVLMGKKKLWDALQKKQKLFEHDHFTEEECHQLESLEKIISDHHGYTASSEAARLLEGLGLLANVHEKPLKTLSGGYKLRVLLAQLLFSNPDVLLLDEPTNHLDLFSIRWLEEYLKNFPGTLLISSHDRHFLNGTCDHIVDLDYETIKIYKGNFEDFEAIKAADREQKQAMLSKQDKKREDLQRFVDRFKATASKARQAQSKMHLVEKLENEMDELNIRPSTRMFPKLRFDLVRPSGVKTLAVNDLSKSYGAKQVLKNVSFEVERGDRIAFLGANGIGKSTLLEIINEKMQQDLGSFEWGFAAQIAYFPQDHAREVNGSETLLQWLSRADRQMPEERLREVLARVLFTGDDVHKPVNILSGGETARLILAKMMVLKHNILIFDEPTNHLDMESIEMLVDSLQAYPGTILFVSHNRHFVSRLAKRIIEMTPEGIEDFPLTFEEYLLKRDVDHLSGLKQVSKEIASGAGKQSYEEQKKQRNLKAQNEKKAAKAEEKCQMFEQKLESINKSLAEAGLSGKGDPIYLNQLAAKKSEMERRLEEALAEWEKITSEV